MQEEPSLQPLDLTYVVYDANDPLSLALALLTFLPIAGAVALFTWFVARRELETGFFFSGYCASTLLNSALKRVFREPRPAFSAKRGYGMPSDHAQAMFFVLTYLWLLFRTRVSVRGWIRGSVLLATGSLGVIVAYSRVYLGVHTVSQVIAGSLVGCVFGFLYFQVGDLLIRPVYSKIEEWKLSQFFLLKDSGPIDNVLRFEWSTSKDFGAPLECYSLTSRPWLSIIPISSASALSRSQGSRLGGCEILMIINDCCA